MIDVIQDYLTGLPNLIGMVDELRAFPEHGVLAALDMDLFAAVNRDHGVAKGDAVLRAMGHALTEICQSSADGWRAYRVGGDGFALYLPRADRQAADEAIAQLRRDLARRLVAGGLPAVDFHSSTAAYPSDGRSLAQLLAQVESRIMRITSAQAPVCDGQWVEGLLEWFISRLRETVDALRFAETMALTDPVSGMPNHRAARRFIAGQLAAAAGRPREFAVLFIDGDNLKTYNEALGYEQGNELLRDMGAVIASSLRAADHVSRWLSGDEFLAVLPATGTDAAVNAAERIRAAIMAASTGWALPVTVSIGVATCPAHGCDVDLLLEAAAEANAEAKRRGKNRVVLGEPRG